MLLAARRVPRSLRFRFRLPVCELCLILALSFGVFAQTAAQALLPPEAQEAVHKGVLAANQQDYLLAIRFFQDARKIATQSPEIYYNLGLAESKIPGRELRAIAWLAAFLAANPGAPNAAAVKEQIDVLDVKSHSNLSRLLTSFQDQIRQSPASFTPLANYMGGVASLWVLAGDMSAARKLAADFNGGADANNDIWALISFAQFQNATLSSDWVRNDEFLDQMVVALKSADLIRDAGERNFWKIMEQSMVFSRELDAGDVPGAQATVSAMEVELKGVAARHFDDCSYLIDSNRLRIAQAQIEAGLLHGAQETANTIGTGVLQSIALGAIAHEQALAGDIVGAKLNAARALKVMGGDFMTADHREATDSVVKALESVVEALLRVADPEDAQQTMVLIPANSQHKKVLQQEIDHGVELKRKGEPPKSLFTNSSSIRTTPASTPSTAAIRPKPSDWIKRLDDADQTKACALDTAPFLDLVTQLKSLPPVSEPKRFFAAEEGPIEAIAKAQRMIDSMLRQQARE